VTPRLRVRIARLLDTLACPKEPPVTLPDYAVNFRGYPACPCLAAWLPVYEAELQRRGLLAGPLRIYQLIGGYVGSGGTHASGGAFDLLDLPGEEEVWVARQMGADATWTRPYNWDHEGGIAHNHGVLSGCPHNGPARYQIYAVQADYNGLGYLGHSAPDDGPRPLSGRTWRQGIAWAHQQEDDMKPEDFDRVQQIVDKAIADATPAIAAAAAKAFLNSDVIAKFDVSVREVLRAEFNKGAAAKGQR
jgi:hypothetical protein